MNHFSYLSYKECHDQDLFLEANGVSISSLIKNAGHLIATWVKENIKTKPLVGIIGKGKNGKDVLVAFEQIPDNKPLF
ncbi:MAG: hypothetical protein VW397_06290, partial [Candidatus Margulisiibacteriota bacterium]